jgi:hypothetical protein
LTFGLVAAALPGRSQIATQHAPDGGARETIPSISIPPMANAPFRATVTLEFTKHLADGSTTTIQNHRLVVRDSRGNIYQERRMLVPPGQEPQIRSIEISSPVTHTIYSCDPGLTLCELWNYYTVFQDPMLPAKGAASTPPGLSRVDLGFSTMEGLEVVGTRETTTIPPGSVGNTAPLQKTKEFWYSPRLGLNLRVVRIDPLQGDQTLGVSNIELSEPDPQLFVLPPNCKIVDKRREQ